MPRGRQGIPGYVMLAVAGLLAHSAAEANPCAGKVWVDRPILALDGRGGGEGEEGVGVGGTGRSDEGRGIGGTGHGGSGLGGTGAVARRDERGMGGTGHGPGDEGIGGTGHGQDGQGIGGTGRSGSGMGGTGMMARGDQGDDGIGGTGIVGVVAGFGSICVNGLEVHYPASVPVSVDGRPSQANRLALGQIVSVRAELHAGEYRAREIAVLDEVVGPVERVDAVSGLTVILGQAVRLPVESVGHVVPGDWLAVSGDRMPDGTILPTRVARTGTAGEAVLIASVAAARGQHLDVGGKLEVELAAGLPLPVSGEEVLLRGRVVDGVLRARFLAKNPRTGFSVPVARLELQGYVRQSSARELNVDGMRVVLPAQVPGLPSAAQAAGSRLQVSGRALSDGRIVADRIRLEKPAGDSHVVGPGGAAQGSAGGARAGSVTGVAPEGEGAAAGGATTTSVSVSVAAARSALAEDDAVYAPSVPETAAQAGGVSQAPASPLVAVQGGISSAGLGPERGGRLDIGKREVSRLELGRPEIARPEIARPEIARPEIARPEIARPEVPRLEVHRPEPVRIERPERGR